MLLLCFLLVTAFGNNRSCLWLLLNWTFAISVQLDAYCSIRLGHQTEMITHEMIYANQSIVGHDTLVTCRSTFHNSILFMLGSLIVNNLT